MSMNCTHPLERQTVNQAFISYLVPSVLGVLVIAFNFIIDCIMVGHKLGSTAMAGIGMGGATLYSNHMGRKEHKKAKEVFTKSIILIALITMAIGYTAYTFKDKLVYALGANADTFPFASDYMNINYRQNKSYRDWKNEYIKQAMRSIASLNKLKSYIKPQPNSSKIRLGLVCCTDVWTIVRAKI